MSKPLPALLPHPERLLPTGTGRHPLAGVVAGADALVLAELARRLPGGLIHIAQDDAAVARLQAALQFFAPDLPLRLFPAWDCLPYDRVSPKPEMLAQRIETLSALLAHGEARSPGPILVLTTVNAATQRTVPRQVVRESVLQARVGGRLNADDLRAFLVRTGYNRADTVREPGEFAIRGGIVDLFPPGWEDPIRIDLFGDEIEDLRQFDPITQRTTERLPGFALRPASEVMLDADSIQRFRTAYREAFGAVSRGGDPLYEAIGEGRKHLGMEHWLPFFHGGLETLFDFLPRATVSRDHQAVAAHEARWQTVLDFYEARHQVWQGAERGGKGGMAAGLVSGGGVYKPVPPDTLFLSPATLEAVLSDRAILDLSPFRAASEGGAGADAGSRRGHDFVAERQDPDRDLFAAIRAHGDELRGQGRRLLVAAYSEGARERLATLFTENGIVPTGRVRDWAQAAQLPKRTIAMAVLPLETGFVTETLAVLTEQDLLGDRIARAQSRRRKREGDFLTEVSAINEGDLVVHVDHGIGRFEGLVTIDAGGAPHECLRVVYHGGDKLFVPVENIDTLSRYGKDTEGVTVALDRLGGGAWQARKAAVKQRLKDMAEALMRVAAARYLKQAPGLPPPDRAYQEFAARFPYPETDDQMAAILAVQEDLMGGRAMDRLVCGDVGFGKTEVALRAAFIAAMNGLQVAVVTPTTLLARQHARTFQARFRGFPVRVEQLSRLVAPKEAKVVKAGLADGSVDIVIGTHALLAKGIAFQNLGLLIVDEEQRFGVKQKERLKEIKAEVHVLTLTATPIPRTLQLAMAGVRELSLIATPPVDRLAVRTFVLPFDPVVIREALMREHFRGGQSFFVVPRIEDLKAVGDMLGQLVPELKRVVAHGKLPAAELEEVMSAFIDGQYDLLIATNIIESGIDIPNANTLIVHRADLFGLAQLYQIRGRIGRGKIRGYAYLTWAPDKPLSRTSQQRLQVIETLDTLGAGFTLASHDMDIRGAGNLLGEEQSGHIKEVGVELYQQMLEEAVAMAKGVAAAKGAEEWSPTLHLGVPVMIPEHYVPDLNVRLSLYRRLSDLREPEAVEAFRVELIDRFGTMPAEAENLARTIELKAMSRKAGVERLDVGPKGAVVAFRGDRFANVDGLLKLVADSRGRVRVRPDQKLLVAGDWPDDEARMKGARTVLEQLVALVA